MVVIRFAPIAKAISCAAAARARSPAKYPASARSAIFRPATGAPFRTRSGRAASARPEQRHHTGARVLVTGQQVGGQRDLGLRPGRHVRSARPLPLVVAHSGGAEISRSARLLGAADEILAALGETVEPLEGGLRDLDCQRLRSAMGAEAFETECEAGRA